MNKPIFRVTKSSYYSNGEKDFEDYEITMNSKRICFANRDEIEELYQQLNIALNDQKEECHE